MLKKVIEDFISVRSVITLSVFFTVCYLSISGRVSEQVLVDFAKYLLAFWFGQKAGKYMTLKNQISDKKEKGGKDAIIQKRK